MATTKTKKKTDELPEKVKEKFIRTAARALLISKLHGTKAPRIQLSDLDLDGRVAKKYARLLVEQGLIKREADKLERLCVTDKVFDCVEETKPDFVQKLTERTFLHDRIQRGTDNEYAYGAALYSLYGGESWLTPGEMAYVCRHPDEFTFRFYRQYLGCIDHEFGAPWDHKISGRDAYDAVVLVSTDAYDSHVYEMRLSERIKTLYNQNIAWGLKALCGVNEDDASLMVADGSVRLPRVAPDGLSELDWSEIHRTSMADSENALAYHTRKLEALHRIQMAVAKYGGWDKFKADYRQQIADHLRKQDEGED